MARTLTGIVVSTKTKNVAVVEIESRRTHPKYHKHLKKTRRLKARTTKEVEVKVGDKVTICEIRPMSRQTTWGITPRGTEEKYGTA